MPRGIVYAPGQTQSTNTSANPNPQMQLVGADAVAFAISASPARSTTLIVTFPNLPVRDVQNNPLTGLASTKNTLQIGPNGHLLLFCFVQGQNAANGTVVTATPIAITKDGVRATGPFLGSEVFATFQAKIVVSNSPIAQQVKGSIGAHLMLALG